MANVMMAIGEYRFSVDAAAYDALRRHSQYRWAPVERIAHRPSLQYVGQGSEGIDLRGTIYPQYKGGLRQLDHMRLEAGKGKPLALVTGRGENLGPWCIVEVEEEQAVFAAKGTPRAIEFRMRLEYYGPDKEEVGALAFVAPKPAASNRLPAPPALVGQVDLTKAPQITTAQLAPYSAGITQAGMTPQQATSALNTAVARLRAIRDNAETATKVLNVISWDYNSLQSGIMHDPVGTMGRLLTSVSGLGAGAKAALATLMGPDIAGKMTQLGAAFSLSQQISRSASVVTGTSILR